MVRALGLPECDSHLLHVGELLLDLVCKGLVGVLVQASGCDILVKLDSEALLDVLLVGYDHIGVLCELPHDLRCALSVLPELLAVVKVDRDRGSGLLCGLHCLKGAVSAALADSRCDSCDMEPGGLVHGCGKVIVRWL